LANDAAVYVDATAPVVLVKGPKRSGKSTIARTALNGLLQLHERVAWLECDLGQGEFGCGGVIGLWVLDAPVYGLSLTKIHNVVIHARSSAHG
jgi:polynucleotide 5'-hydroxyl-kinase GRC3/NOL9